MKGTLIFKLPEEEVEFRDAQKGGEYSAYAHEYDDYLRSRLKYEELSDEVRQALQGARDKLHELWPGMWE